MDKCFVCHCKDVVRTDYSKRSYCKGCFLKVIEHRFRKDVREKGFIKPNCTVKIYDAGSNESRAAFFLLDKVFKGHLEVKKVRTISDDVLVATNIEREVDEKLSAYLEDKDPPKNHRRLLSGILEDEIITLCQIQGLKVSPKKGSIPLIESIESLQPGTKFALSRSLERLFP